MKKVIVFGLVLILVLSVVSGCSGNKEDVAENIQETPAPTEDVTGDVQIASELEQMVDHFRGAGLKIGQYEEKNYGIIGATSGFGLEVEGGNIELYYYDPDETDSDILDALENKHNPDATYAIVINGYYELALALHPEQERIIEVFMNY
ncbi:hypothetical protein [Petrocella sp. FN5]|uniref:hypothetical protein n=1 Tax=Petrocella sp. FN5 TaxID=3032002 RepID=UPI0023DB6124|nr:hypothetical protein [Petrocella sp. FN5]MDF1618049.1 hypothetical protein [Petrocella sp. FN5]